MTANPVETIKLSGGLLILAIDLRYVLTVETITSPSLTILLALDGADENVSSSMERIPTPALTLDISTYFIAKLLFVVSGRTSSFIFTKYFSFLIFHLAGIRPSHSTPAVLH